MSCIVSLCRVIFSSLAHALPEYLLSGVVPATIVPFHLKLHLVFCPFAMYLTGYQQSWHCFSLHVLVPLDRWIIRCWCLHVWHIRIILSSCPYQLVGLQAETHFRYYAFRMFFCLCCLCYLVDCAACRCIAVHVTCRHICVDLSTLLTHFHLVLKRRVVSTNYKFFHTSVISQWCLPTAVPTENGTMNFPLSHFSVTAPLAAELKVVVTHQNLTLGV